MIVEVIKHTDEQVREVQELYLKHPLILKRILEEGWDAQAAWESSPTFRQLAEDIYPDWVVLWVQFIEDNREQKEQVWA